MMVEVRVPTAPRNCMCRMQSNNSSSSMQHNRLSGERCQGLSQEGDKKHCAHAAHMQSRYCIAWGSFAFNVGIHVGMHVLGINFIRAGLRSWL
jgi:hypothetical protein